MKKFIAIAVLTVGVLVWRMGAMEQDNPKRQKMNEPEESEVFVQTKDGEMIAIPGDKAKFMQEITRVRADVPIGQAIPLAHVTKAELVRIMTDLEWVKKTFSYESETDPLTIRKAVLALQKRQPALSLSQLFAALKAADYLQIPALIQRYAKEIAEKLSSYSSTQFLDDKQLIGKILEHRMESEIYAYMPYRAKGFERPSMRMGAFSPDGTYMLAVYGQRASIWNADGFSKTIDNGTALSAAAFSSDSKWIVTASGDSGVTGKETPKLKIWDVQNGTLVRSFANNIYRPLYKDYIGGARVSVAFSSDEKIVAVHAKFGSGYVPEIWDAKTGELRRAFESHRERVGSAVFSPDNTQILTSSWNGAVEIWDANTGESIHKFTGKIPCSSALFSPNGKWVLVGFRNGTAKMWDVTNYQLLPMFKAMKDTAPGENKDDNMAIAFSQDSRWVVTGYQRTIQIWDTYTYELLHTMVLATKDTIHSVAIHPDKSKIMVARGNGISVLMLPQTPKDLDKAVFMTLVRSADRNKTALSVTDRSWVNRAFDGYSAEEKRLLKIIYPAAFQE